jgi:hypothetical protein
MSVHSLPLYAILLFDVEQSPTPSRRPPFGTGAWCCGFASWTAVSPQGPPDPFHSQREDFNHGHDVGSDDEGSSGR